MTRNRDMLLKEIMQLSFRLYDLTLFLDTHPNNTEALKMFNSYKTKYEALLRAYETAYGPITTMGVKGNTSWDWIKAPWPWEPMKETMK